MCKKNDAGKIYAKKILQKSERYVRIHFAFGPVAQLGERSVRIREVKGSNPSRSTTMNDPAWSEQRDVIVQARQGLFMPETIAPRSAPTSLVLSSLPLTLYPVLHLQMAR